MPEETLQSSELKVVPVEEQITNELVKANVTEAIIANLKEKYMPLQIKGIDDKETYLIVKDARKEVKALRVMAEKLCKKGREEAVAIQKAWVKREKEVTDQIAEVEDHLEKQEKDFEAQVAAEKERRKREQEEQFILRQQTLSGMGALYADGNFTIGEVSFEMSLIKECDPDIWDNDIKPKFEAEYKIVQAEILEQERLKQEKEAEFKKQQEEFEYKQRELEQKETALKAALEEQERKQREEEAKKQAEERNRIEKLWRSRLDQLDEVGWNGQEAFARYDDSIVVATYEQLITLTDEEFQPILISHNKKVAAIAEEEKQKRLAEIEAQKEAERIKILGKSRSDMLKQYNANMEFYPIDSLGKMEEAYFEDILAGWQSAYEIEQRSKWEKEQEEKHKAEELRKQQEMEQAKDKEKWSEMIRQVNAVEVYEMRSSQYRTKALKFRQKLDELKALFDAFLKNDQ